jgi:ankyrin repeat protein
LDAEGNPVLKYSCVTPASDAFVGGTQGYEDNPRAVFFDTAQTIRCHTSALMALVIREGADVNVSCARKCFALHWVVAGASLQLTMRRRQLSLIYESVMTAQQRVRSLVQELLQAGARTDLCDAHGRTPLYCALAAGQVQSAEELLVAGANPNLLDDQGLLALHAACSMCSEGTLNAAKLLLRNGAGRPVESARFSDCRKGKDRQEKALLDTKAAVAAALDEALTPRAIRRARVSLAELVETRSLGGLSSLVCAYGGPVLCPSVFACPVRLQMANPVRSSYNSTERFALIQWLRQEREADAAQMEHKESLSLLHPAMLWFLAEATQCNPLKQVPPTESACEKTGAASLQLALDAIHTLLAQGALVNAPCAIPVPDASLSAGWLPLEAAILSDNVAACRSLLQHGASLLLAEGTLSALHFALTVDASDAVILELVTAGEQLEDPHVADLVFNGESHVNDSTKQNTTPLFLALNRRRKALLGPLAEARWTDPNKVPKGCTYPVLVQAVCNGDVPSIWALACVKKVRINGVDALGLPSSLEIALHHQNAEALGALLQARTCDAMHVLLALNSRSSDTLLRRVEADNMNLVERLVHLRGNRTQIDSQSINHEALEECRKHNVEQAQSMSELAAALEASDALVSMLVTAANDLGMVAMDHHAHACFTENIMYSQFVGLKPR